MEKPDQPRQVIHLHFLENDEHHYYGSISAMYDHYSRSELGVASQTLYNKWKDEPFQNDKVVIRKGRLIQKKRGDKSES